MPSLQGLELNKIGASAIFEFDLDQDAHECLALVRRLLCREERAILYPRQTKPLDGLWERR